MAKSKKHKHLKGVKDTPPKGGKGVGKKGQRRAGGGSGGGGGRGMGGLRAWAKHRDEVERKGGGEKKEAGEKEEKGEKKEVGEKKEGAKGKEKAEKKEGGEKEEGTPADRSSAAYHAGRAIGEARTAGRRAKAALGAAVEGVKQAPGRLAQAAGEGIMHGGLVGLAKEGWKHAQAQKARESLAGAGRAMLGAQMAASKSKGSGVGKGGNYDDSKHPRDDHGRFSST